MRYLEDAFAPVCFEVGRTNIKEFVADSTIDLSSLFISCNSVCKIFHSLFVIGRKGSTILDCQTYAIVPIRVTKFYYYVTMAPEKVNERIT